MGNTAVEFREKTTLELLPNEILIECFEYLNGPDIIDAFERLNIRFQSLIESISLYVDFQMIQKSQFDRFCHQLLQKSSLREQISSLKLSDSLSTCHQIEIFLSFFSLDQFNQLRSLTMKELDEEKTEKLRLILPKLVNLRRLSYSNQRLTNCQILMDLSSLKIETLSIPTLSFDPSIDQIKSLRHLTVSDNCSVTRLCQFFQCSPMLKYLNINELLENSTELSMLPTKANCLTSLIIKKMFQTTFSLLKMLFKHTPTLEELFLSIENSREIFDALHWEDLIISFLPHLTILKFQFRVHDSILTSAEILKRFEEFQNDFWHKDHQWYTVCITDDNQGILSTIPYYSNQLKLNHQTNIYCNKSISKSDLFRRVTTLKISCELLTNLSDYYFSNIRSLIISYPLFHSQTIESIRMNINLFHVKFLGLEENCRIDSALILLNILQQTSNLSQMTISKDILLLILNNLQLNQYVKRRIKKLNLSKHCNTNHVHSIIYYNELPRFCQIFSNLEQIQCCIVNWNDITTILSQLHKLSHMKVSFLLRRSDDIYPFLQRIRTKLNRNFLYEYFDSSPCRLYIWTGEYIN